MIGLAAVGVLAATPAHAQTVPLLDEARLRAAIAEAKQARNSAEEALRKADEAIAKLEDALSPAQASPAAMASATELRTPDGRHPAYKRPADMPACDAPGSAGSIGEYMLRMDGADRQKKEASLDPGELETDRGVNAFVYHCLGLTRATDYEAITNLSVQFTGTKGNDQAETAITRTARAMKPTTMFDSKTNERVAALVSTYNRYRLGGFGRTGSNGEVPLIDLTESNFASGVGVLAGFEWGRSRRAKLSSVRTSINDGIAKARQECLAANGIVDPLRDPGAASTARPRISLDPLSSCEGDALVRWMSESKRANQYWGDVVAPLWGYRKDPELFAGIEGRYAFQDLSYRPVIDRATGAVITTTLPAAVRIHPEPYSVKLYGGFNREVGPESLRTATLGLTGSLTYRREIDFIEGTIGKTLCAPAAPGATFDICSADQKLAAPYDTSGFVAGAALNLQFRRFWYMPPVALSPRFTYAFDTRRPGVEIPIFLLTDGDGKLNSGIKYTCRFRGRTPEGLELKKTCNINLFLGTSFEVGKTP